MNCIRTIIISLWIVCALPALAVDKGWYLGGALQFVDFEKGTTEFRRPAEDGLFGSPAQDFRFKSDIDGDETLSILAGWDAPSYGIRIELEYRQYASDINTFGTSESGQVFTEDAKARQFIITAWHDIRGIGFLPDTIVPYLGLGVGGANVEFDGEDDTAAMVQLGIGVGYWITDIFIADMNYRYFEAEPLFYNPPAGDVTTKYKGEIMAVGLRWYFGKSD